MGFLDKAKEKASQLAGEAKGKLDEVKDKRKADGLLEAIGRIVFRQHTERAEAGDEAEIARLVDELRALEAEGTEVVAPATPAADATTPPPPPPPPPAEAAPVS